MENNLGNNPLGAIASNVFDPKEQYFKGPKPTTPTELPQNLRDILITKLTDFFYRGYYEATGKSKAEFPADLSALLEETGAIVSGGFILWALGLYPDDEFTRGPWSATQPDIDIYVPCENVVKLYSKLGKWMQTTDVKSYKQTKYCSSFLKRNGIRRVYTFEKYANGPLMRGGMGHHRYIAKSMDIMSVRNARDVRDVVKNFDLTFTMNWYDGDKLYSMYPKHLDHKIGLLQGDYVKMFLTGNRFLIKRMKKYTKKRGFDIRLDPEEVAKHTIAGSGDLGNLFCHLEKPPRNEAFYTSWATKALFEFLLTKKYRCSRTKEWDQMAGAAMYHDSPPPLFGDDGYDSDEFELKALNDPAKDTVKAKFVEIATVKAVEHDPTLEALEPEEKFWHLVTRCISYFYSNSPDKSSPFLANWGYVRGNEENATIRTIETQLQEILNTPEIKRCLDALKGLFVRIDMDLVTLDDVQVYDFHAHVSAKGASKATIDGLLTNNKTIANKDEIPCYLPPEECGRYLTRNDVRPFADPAIFNQFVSYKPPIQQIPLGELTDWGAILRNDARRTDSWGAINKQTMCPFCLRQEERHAGCAYMLHAHEGTYDAKKMPYCSPTEQVKELWEKYRDYQKRLPDSYQGLEYCAICGRPCHGHSHFDLANPGQIAPTPVTARGDPDYGKCAGGGRAELVARMLAARAVLLAHRGNAEPVNAEIRREAAFAADAAPLDPALMDRARAILAQEAAARKFNNDGVNEYSATGWPPGGPSNGPGVGRRGGPGGDEEAKVAEEDDEIIVPVEVPNAEAPPANPLLAALDEMGALPAPPPNALAPAGHPPPPPPPQNWAAGLNPDNFADNNVNLLNLLNNNNLQGGRRYTRGRRKSAMKKRLRTQRNSRR